jgi:hypothetical protein
MPRKSMRSRSRSRRGGFDFNSLNPFASKDPDVPPPAYPPPTSSGIGYSQSPTSSGIGYSQSPTSSGMGYSQSPTSSGMGYSRSPTSSGMGYSRSPTSSGMGYSQQPANMGGKKGKRRRSMRGGDYSDNISLNNLAANAAPFSNGNTATASYVGGRTRRHRHNKSCKITCRKHHRHTKSCRHRKH